MLCSGPILHSSSSTSYSSFFPSSSTFSSRVLIFFFLFFFFSLPRTLITLWRDLAQLAFTLTTGCFPLVSSLLSFMSKGARPLFAARFLKRVLSQTLLYYRSTFRYNFLVNCDLRAPITHSYIMVFCICRRGKLWSAANSFRSFLYLHLHLILFRRYRWSFIFRFRSLGIR